MAFCGLGDTDLLHLFDRPETETVTFANVTALFLVLCKVLLQHLLTFFYRLW